MATTKQEVEHRWRDYRTATGKSPVRDFLMALEPGARTEVVAAMKDVKENGLEVARHLLRDIYEVRASYAKIAYRVLFAQEGAKGRILLSLETFSKKSQKTPKSKIDLAEARLRDWRERGVHEQ